MVAMKLALPWTCHITIGLLPLVVFGVGCLFPAVVTVHSVRDGLRSQQWCEVAVVAPSAGRSYLLAAGGRPGKLDGPTLSLS
jgi:hypothetical protein